MKSLTSSTLGPTGGPAQDPATPIPLPRIDP